MNERLLWPIVAAFAPLSLVMFGGANAIIPEIQHQAVEVRGWMSNDEFATLFAIAQVAPGPNILIVSLVGWQVAGLPGLLAATVAINVPHCLLTYGTGRAISRIGDAAWLSTLKAALVPVTIGLILASGAVMARAADHGTLTIAITAATAAFIVLSDRNPLWALGAGTLAMLFGGHYLD